MQREMTKMKSEPDARGMFGEFGGRYAPETLMPALAALAPGLAPVAADDRQTGQALHRRVIGANVRLRSEAGARALARYAANEEHLEAMRSLALEALGRFSMPPSRDLTMGFHRPLAAADPAILAAVFRTDGRALVDSSLGARAMEIMSASSRGGSPSGLFAPRDHLSKFQNIDLAWGVPLGALRPEGSLI